VPSLRRKRFNNANGTAADAFIDEEIVPGVEDLQVRLGVDTNGDTNIDQYVEPGAVPANADVISATIWLRIRAEEREVGHVDGTTYDYADITAVTPNDNFRRILLTKTIHIRNTRA
jgi:type IV pilus assembly protein PilW